MVLDCRTARGQKTRVADRLPLNDGHPSLTEELAYQKVELRKVEAQKVEAQKVEVQKVEAQKVKAQKVEVQKVEVSEGRGSEGWDPEGRGSEGRCSEDRNSEGVIPPPDYRVSLGRVAAGRDETESLLSAWPRT